MTVNIIERNLFHPLNLLSYWIEFLLKPELTYIMTRSSATALRLLRGATSNGYFVTKNRLVLAHSESLQHENISIRRFIIEYYNQSVYLIFLVGFNLSY